MKLEKIHILCFLVFASLSINAQSYIVNCTVYDSSNNLPVKNAVFEIEKLSIKSESDAVGKFSFTFSDSGTYIFSVNADGYNKLTRAVYLSSQISDLNFYLRPSSYSTDTIDVQAQYYKKELFATTSVSNYTYKEMYRTVGAGEDIIRHFQNTSGVAVDNDVYNGMIVRGGAPTENLIMVDGMELLNPNHFGPPGSSYGVFSFINLHLVNNAVFYTGGFPANYGGKISSIMNIKFKEGSSRLNTNWNVSMVGFGIFSEGPITKESNFMVSVRRSYFEIVKEQLNMGAFPDYWDMNFKLTWNLNKNSKLALFGVWAWDRARPNLDFNIYAENKNADIRFGNTALKYTSAGKNRLFSLMFSNSLANYGADYGDYSSIGYTYFKINVEDDAYTLKSEYNSSIDSVVMLDVSSAASISDVHYDIFSEGSISKFGFVSPPIYYVLSPLSLRFYTSLSASTHLLNKRLMLTAGLRYDYFSLMRNNSAVSPRAGASYKVTNNFFVNASWGLYKQSPEILWILADPSNKDLKYIKADSYVLGFEYFPHKTIRFNLEGYYKHYTDYPVSVYDPYYIFINSGLNIYPNFLDRAVSEGKGYVRGIDFSIEKKNDGSGFYGNLVLSYIATKFKALYGSGQRGEFDFGKQLLLISGFRFNENFSFAFRMKYSDGKPITPPGDPKYYDYTKINTLRIPSYLRFDARIDVNFKTGPVNVDTYFEVENLFDKDNYADGKWNWYWNNWYYYKQWSIVPVVGINIKL